MRPSRVQMLKSIVDAQPELYLDEMQEKLFTRYGELYALSTLSRTLRCTLRYSLRVIQEKAAQRDAEERAAFQLMARDLVPNADMWIYMTRLTKGVMRHGGGRRGRHVAGTTTSLCTFVQTARGATRCLRPQTSTGLSWAPVMSSNASMGMPTRTSFVARSTRRGS